MFWSLLALLGLLLLGLDVRITLAAIRGDADSFVQIYDVSSDCKMGEKNVRNLKTGAAIFYYNETQEPLYDFSCHYELETARGYGFHVYFDEMYLNELSGSGQSPCKDYVQFGRDKAFVTTYQSPHYCGFRSRFQHKINGSVFYTGGQGSRMYVEEKDSEMDVWIRIEKRDPSSSLEIRRPRQLQMTVTVIRNDCGANHPYFRQCRNTEHCIRREFFCDGRVNCAWPDAEEGGTDEVNCDTEDEPYRGPFNTRGATNIPLVVVMIIVATAFLVVILIFAKKFFSLFCKSANLPRSNSNSELRRTARRGRGATVSASVTPPEPSEDRLLHQGPSSTEVPESYPSAPPSYEEVIKDNPGVLSRGVPSAPPPYSESLTMTQV